MAPCRLADMETDPRGCKKHAYPSQPASGIPGSGPLPPYEGDSTGQSSIRTQHSKKFKNSDDEFGTVVTEVTTVLTITCRKHRVENP